MISNDLRQGLSAGIHLADGFLQNYSPYSYLAVAVIVFGGVTLSLLAGQKAR